MLNRLLAAALVAMVLGCTSGSDRVPTAPSGIDPAPPVATVPVASRDPSSTTSIVSWACVVGSADRSVSSGSGWTIHGERCLSASVDRDRPVSDFGPLVFAAGPTNLRATVTGTAVQLTWDQPGVAFAWQLEAGSGPGLSNIAVFRTTGGTSLTITGVPARTYYLRVRSAPPDFSDLSNPSNEITVSVGPCAGPPRSPTGLHTSVLGNQVTLSWTQPSGEAATSYALEVGASTGSYFLLLESTTSLTTMTVTAPNGIYFVRIRAKNACGTSGPSNEIDVPVGIDLPPPPTAAFTIVASSGYLVPASAIALCSYNINQPCRFNGSSSGGTGIRSYLWDFGDGRTAEGAIVTYTWTRPTMDTGYTVTLTVIDAFGRPSRRSRDIIVSPFY